MTKRGTATNAGGDFKRLKAKVGKRAPKKLNATDTSFKTGSIRATSEKQAKSLADNIVDDKQINSNNQVLEAVSDIVSTKVGGKTLQELIQQLVDHPSPSARKSALTGIRDVIQIVTDFMSGAVVDRNVGLHIIRGVVE